MKIAFIGAGALGSSLAGFLAEAGNDVVLVDTWAAHVDAINSRGLLLREGTIDRTVRIKAVTNAAGLAHADLVVVLVKSFATREAITAALPMVGEHTLVMSIQNGLGHEDILADVVGRSKVLGAKTFAGGQLLAPGHVMAGVQGKETLVGELDGRITPRAQAVADVFSRAGLATRASDNIMGVMWEKLLINVSTAALTGITRLPYGPFGRVAEVEATALQAVAEAMAVARAGGVRLTTTEPLQAWTKATAGLPEGFKPSLLQSLEKGERTEIDFINGAVVAWGKRLSIPTPVNSTLLACVKGIEYAQSTLKDKP
jgi:2-dehydropantoate 2-reductase